MQGVTISIDEQGYRKLSVTHDKVQSWANMCNMLAQLELIKIKAEGLPDDLMWLPNSLIELEDTLLSLLNIGSLTTHSAEDCGCSECEPIL